MCRFLCLILLLTLLCLPHSAPGLSQDFEQLESLYKRGALDELPASLNSAKPKTDEEQALALYLAATLKLSSKDAIPLLQQGLEKYPATLYGQRCMLERAKIHLLERQIDPAQALLQKINHPALWERFFWLSLCAEARDDADATIAHAENYLRLEPSGAHIEDAYYLIAGAYQKLSKFQSAIATLNKLSSLPDYPRREQYFHYFLGTLHRQANELADAVRNYKLGFELNRNSPLALQIEDALLELKARHPNLVDLNFLYPYSELAITLPDSLGTIPDKDPVDTTPVKLQAKPGGGYFVQAGRFGVETNANQLALQLREFRLLAHYYEDKANKATPWVVVSGPYSTRDEADAARQLLLSRSIDSFITRF